MIGATTDYTRAFTANSLVRVLQETWLKAGTIHENIAFSRPDATREEVIAAAKAANADFFIRQLHKNFDTYLSRCWKSLSQGQRQLLTIAPGFPFSS